LKLFRVSLNIKSHFYKKKRYSMKFKISMFLLIAVSLSATAEIRQELGVDQSVDYASLTQYGPWDDRNYNLTAADIALLPEDDQYLANVPAFFKVEKRKELPNLGKYYPRATLQHFQILHGGLLVDGYWYKEELGKGKYQPRLKPGQKLAGIELKGTIVDPDVEVPFEVGVAGNEVSVECNPTNKNICVAGSNTSNGQTMYYSTDSGLTWTKSQTNASSCCDPTIDWSLDGSIVYQADLSSSIGVRWTRSLDQGVTWEPMKVLTASGSDKEWIHVDRSPSSPHKDNVYLTYHNSNVMQFARSTDMGQTMSTPLAFGSEETGIGSDIATDSAGNIYYVYPGLQGGGIRMLKSTDGGVTFQPGVQVAPLNGIFDFPIPSMESREAFIYVSVDVDSNDNIYVAFTDEADDSAGGGNGSASQNHGVVKVAKSTDGGASWSLLPSPHATNDCIAGPPTCDLDAIDRYHPWLMVSENDAVHIGFYDTRHSANRTGVDFYYNVSLDGGASWLPEGEQRYSTQTSGNLSDGQEWGDYNGLSVVMDKIVMTWTDNRSGKVAMAGAGDNPFAVPSFNVTPDPSSSISVCAGNNYSIDFDVAGTQGYSETVTLTEQSIPGFVVNGSLSPDMVVPDATSTYSFNVDNSGTNGPSTATIRATGPGVANVPADQIFADGFEAPVVLPPIVKDIDLAFFYADGAPVAANLTAPTDLEANVPTKPTFAWDAQANAESYLIEIATDNGFTNIVDSATVATNSYTPESDLATETVHYWRVTTNNACDSEVSSTFSFTTTVAPGTCAAGTVITDQFAYDFDNDDEGFTVSTATGDTNWALVAAVGNGGTQAFQADDLPAVNDTSLLTPVMSLPTGIGPLTLRFWNAQTIEDRTGGCYDSATLEVSVNGGAFTQVADADIINNAYDGPTDGGFSHPLPGGTPAWCGDPMAGTEFNVNVDAYAGQDVQFAFRMTSDSSVGRPEGWVVDDVRVTGCEAVPPTP
jgi:hypothetical protein